MNRKKLLAKYDFLKPTDLREGCMAFGFEHGDGWLGILERLFADFDTLVKNRKIKDFRVVQVKEKFGGLRVYVQNGGNTIENLIEDAEDESFITCEFCGTKDNVSTENEGWVNTLCQRCRNKKNKINAHKKKEG